MLDFTVNEQNALAAICQILSTPAYRTRMGQPYSVEDMQEELERIFLSFPSLNFGEMYDKFHRQGKNSL